MSLFRQCLDFFLGDSSVPPQAVPVIPSVPNAGGNSAPASPKPDSGHTEKKQVVIEPITLDTPLVEHDEKWLRHGDVMESVATQTRFVTGSGEVLGATDIKSRCICGKYDSDLVRSAVSSCALCRECRKEIILSDGEKVFVSAEEKKRVIDEFDSWEAFDNNVKVPR